MTIKAGTDGWPADIAESKARWLAACEKVCAAGSVKKMQGHMPKVLQACIKNKDEQRRSNPVLTRRRGALRISAQLCKSTPDPTRSSVRDAAQCTVFCSSDFFYHSGVLQGLIGLSLVQLIYARKAVNVPPSPRFNVGVENIFEKF